MDGSGSGKKEKVLLVGHNKTEEKILTEILKPLYEVVISNSEEVTIELLQDKEDVISTAILNSETAIDIIKKFYLGKLP